MAIGDDLIGIGVGLGVLGVASTLMPGSNNERPRRVRVNESRAVTMVKGKGTKSKLSRTKAHKVKLQSPKSKKRSGLKYIPDGVKSHGKRRIRMS